MDDMKALADVLNLDEDDFDILNDLDETSTEEISSKEIVFEDVTKTKKEKKVRVEKVYDNITEPHWLIDKETFNKVLESLSLVMVKTGEIMAKCIMLSSDSKDPNKLNIGFKSNSIQGSIDIDIDNTNNRIGQNKHYVLDYFKLLVVVRNSDSKVVLKEKNDTLACEILDGNVELENYAGFEKKVFNKKDIPETYKKVKLEIGTFTDFVKKVLKTQKLAMRPNSKKIAIKNNGSFSNYDLTYVDYKEVNLPDMNLRFMDATHLIKIIESKRVEPEIFYYFSDTQINFYTDYFHVSYPLINSGDIDYITRIFQSISYTDSFKLNTLDFYKKLNMIRQFTGNSVSVKISVKNGEFTISGNTTNKREIPFVVAKDVSSSINIDLKLPIMNIMNTYNVFKDYPEITFQATSNGRFVYEVDDFRVIFGSLIGKDSE